MRKTLKCSGTVIKADIPSVAGRVYPADELKKALDRSEIPKKLRLYSGSSFDDYVEIGEVEEVVQLANGDVEAQVVIDMDKIAMDKLGLNSLFLTPYGKGIFPPTGVVAGYSFEGIVVSGDNGWDSQSPCTVSESEE